MGNQKSKGPPMPEGVSPSFLKVLEGHTEGITKICSLGDKYLLSASKDGTVKVWSVKKGEYVKIFKGHTFWVECLEVFPPEYVFTGSADNTIRAWSLKTSTCVQVYKGHTNDVTQLQVAPPHLFSSSRDNTVRMWDIESGDLVHEFSGHTNWIEAFAVLGSRLFTSSFDGTSRQWDTESGDCVMEYRGHNSNVQCILVNESDGTLFTGSWDTTIIKWNIETGQSIAVLKGHHDSVSGLKILHRRLFSSSKDNTIKRWDIDSGECVRVFRGHTNPVTCLLLYKNILLSGSDDKRIIAWKVHDKGMYPKSKNEKEILQTDIFTLQNRKARSLPTSPGHSPGGSLRGTPRGHYEENDGRPLTARGNRGRSISLKLPDDSFRKPTDIVSPSGSNSNSSTNSPRKAPEKVPTNDQDDYEEDGAKKPMQLPLPRLEIPTPGSVDHSSPLSQTYPGFSPKPGTPNRSSNATEDEEDTEKKLNGIFRDANFEEKRNFLPPIQPLRLLPPGFSRPRSISLVDYSKTNLSDRKKEKIQILQPPRPENL